MRETLRYINIFYDTNNENLNNCNDVGKVKICLDFKFIFGSILINTYDSYYYKRIIRNLAVDHKEMKIEFIYYYIEK